MRACPRQLRSRSALRVPWVGAIVLLAALATGCAATPTHPPATPYALAPDLVELAALDPSLRLDIRYATANNVFATPLYAQPRAFLQRPVALALLEVERDLRADGLELVVYDAYRPWSVTRRMWDSAKRAWRAGGYVGNPAKGSRHNRGTTVDVTLATLGGAPLEMPTGYDSFATQAHADASDATPIALAHREKLRAAMARRGFTMLPEECWHFDHVSWPQYPVMDVRFEDIPRH
jgi:D-alanyl-D-alanine dipeptidase